LDIQKTKSDAITTGISSKQKRKAPKVMKNNEYNLLAVIDNH